MPLETLHHPSSPLPHSLAAIKKKSFNISLRPHAHVCRAGAEWCQALSRCVVCVGSWRWRIWWAFFSLFCFSLSLMARGTHKEECVSTHWAWFELITFLGFSHTQEAIIKVVENYCPLTVIVIKCVCCSQQKRKKRKAYNYPEKCENTYSERERERVDRTDQNWEKLITM